MSEPGDAPRDWHFHVTDMIGFCERVLDYTAGLDKAAFVRQPDGLTTPPCAISS